MEIHMKWRRLHLSVPDLARSIQVYETPFGAPPTLAPVGG
jgi:hypothetical protein